MLPIPGLEELACGKPPEFMTYPARTRKLVMASILIMGVKVNAGLWRGCGEFGAVGLHQKVLDSPASERIADNTISVLVAGQSKNGLQIPNIAPNLRLKERKITEP